MVSVSDLVAPGYATEELVTAAQAQLQALAAPLPGDAPLYLLLGDAPLPGDDPTALVAASLCENPLGDCYTDNTYGDFDGDAIRLARIASIENQDDTRDVMEAFATLSGVTEDEMAAIERQTLDLYNLLGDPALPTLYAPGEVEFDAVVGVIADGHIDVLGETPGLVSGTALVTLEVDANQHLGLLDPNRVDPAAVNSNWVIANDRLAAQVEVPVLNGQFEASLDVDPDLPGDAFFIKVNADDGAWDAFGHVTLP